jgi:chorismate mutase
LDKKENKEIEKLRDEIDEVDRKMVELLNNRMRCAINLGEIKRRLNLSVYMPEREKEVISNVLIHNTGPLSNDAMRRLYERIIDESRHVEREYSESIKHKK